MKLFLFVDRKSTDYQSKLAKHLDKKFMFLVDSEHGGDQGWLKRNFSELQYLAFTANQWDGEEVVVKKVFLDKEDRDEDEKVVFVVCIQKGEELDSLELDSLEEWCTSMLSISTFTITIAENVATKLASITKDVVMQTPIESSYDYVKDPPEPKYREYGFEFDLDSKQDIGICEIQKPFVERPYTVVLRHFSRDGYSKLFTSLFICPSWGVAVADRLFLRALWTELKMEGEFDLEKMLKEHTESCYPSETAPPLCEPEVYRLDLQGTIHQLNRKRKNMLG